MAREKLSLEKGEQVQMRLRRHWKVLIPAAIWTLISGGAFAALAVALPVTSVKGMIWLAVPFLALFAWGGLRPLLVWMTTRFIFTTERIVLFHGVTRTQRRDILLAQVHDVHSTQNIIIDKWLFHSGTLTIQFGDKKEAVTLANVPEVNDLHTWVSRQARLVESERARPAAADTQAKAAETTGDPAKT